MKWLGCSFVVLLIVADAGCSSCHDGYDYGVYSPCHEKCLKTGTHNIDVCGCTQTCPCWFKAKKLEGAKASQPAQTPQVTPPASTQAPPSNRKPTDASKPQDRARLERLEGKEGRVLEVMGAAPVFHSRKDCPKLKSDSDDADRAKVSCKVTPVTVKNGRIVDTDGFFHDDARLCDRCVE